VAALPEDDWRRRSPEFLEPNLSANLALRDALLPIAARHETTVSAVAVAWVIASPGVTAAIVGARSAGQVDGWIDAARVRLAGEDLAAIGRAADTAAAAKLPTPR
jgi:aryl-alcohol dehydrogenase-like predicted oxidoreductase